jgi:hypothetical protein
MPTGTETITDPTYRALAKALRTRLDVIADRELFQRDPQAHLEALKSASLQIDEHAAALPGPVSTELAHYLHRASFAKALAWIEERLTSSSETNA